MSRLYYDDALAAAWMADKFGVKYKFIFPQQSEQHDWSLPGNYISAHSDRWATGEVTILESSHHIFDSIDDKTKAALQHLGMWPKTEKERSNG